MAAPIPDKTTIQFSWIGGRDIARVRTVRVSSIVKKIFGSDNSVSTSVAAARMRPSWPSASEAKRSGLWAA